MSLLLPILALTLSLLVPKAPKAEERGWSCWHPPAALSRRAPCKLAAAAGAAPTQGSSWVIPLESDKVVVKHRERSMGSKHCNLHPYPPSTVLLWLTAAATGSQSKRATSEQLAQLSCGGDLQEIFVLKLLRFTYFVSHMLCEYLFVSITERQ